MYSQLTVRIYRKSIIPNSVSPPSYPSTYIYTHIYTHTQWRIILWHQHMQEFTHTKTQMHTNTIHKGHICMHTYSYAEPCCMWSELHCRVLKPLSTPALPHTPHPNKTHRTIMYQVYLSSAPRATGQTTVHTCSLSNIHRTIIYLWSAPRAPDLDSTALWSHHCPHSPHTPAAHTRCATWSEKKKKKKEEEKKEELEEQLRRTSIKLKETNGIVNNHINEWCELAYHGFVLLKITDLYDSLPFWSLLILL